MRTKHGNSIDGTRCVKSRSGCKACKTRKIKCDEGLPFCQQCIKRKVQCPGYAQVFTWSSRHERFTRRPDFETGSDTGKLPTANKAVLETCSAIDQQATKFPTAHPADVASAPLTYEYSFGLTGPSPGSCVNRLDMNEANSTPPQLHSYAGRNEDYPPLLRPNEDGNLPICQSAKRTVFLNYWEPSPTTDLVLYSPAVLLHYFGQTICRNLFICDTKDNPMRNVTIDQVRCSALYQALLRYLTAEYLNTTVVTGEAQRILHIAKTDTLFQLQKTGLGATSCRTSKQLLLATMMFGLSASWDGANQTGAEYYRQACAIYQQTIENKPHRDRLFYEYTLLYWWSGLTFVMDSTAGALPEPPLSISSRCNLTTISLHPLVGISPQSYRLIGHVGALVYSQRKLALGRPFIGIAGIRAQENMLRRSQQLEQALLLLQIPQPKDVTGTDGDDTPAADLCNIAQAYRLCALLLLYRCFPDLLHDKLTHGAVQEQTTADQYMCKCALEALDVIERNGVTSRTRSVEQLLLLIIAGELRLLHRKDLPSTSALIPEAMLPYQQSIAASSDCSAAQMANVSIDAQSVHAARALMALA